MCLRTEHRGKFGAHDERENVNPGSLGPPPRAWKTKRPSSCHFTSPTIGALPSPGTSVSTPAPNVDVPERSCDCPRESTFQVKLPPGATLSVIADP